MANRNSTQLVLPGNPLGSVLRETAREARRSTRDSVARATQADLEALQAEVDALQAENLAQQDDITALQGRIIATTAVTAPGGIGTWVYPAPYVNLPVLLATPVGGVPLFCVIFAPTLTQTQFIVWDASSTGVGGVTVNLLAYSLD